MVRQTYVGDLPDLKGKTALVQAHMDSPRLVMAQFDDLDVRRQDVLLAFGWHPFLRREFQ